MNASASAMVLFIFQFPAMNGVRMLTEGPPRRAGLTLDELERSPPPVERWSTSSARPNWASAAAESPPPTTVVPGAAAIASATRFVPAANGSSSNAPIGPFQNTVPASRSRRRSARRSGADVEAHPAVRDVDPVELAALGVGLELAAGDEVLGSTILSCPASLRAGSTPASSHSESPTSWPWALKNGKHIAPPIRIASARSRNASSTPILSVTLAPPTTATSGRFGVVEDAAQRRDLALQQAPGGALGSSRATASVEACARWAAPNASLT